MVHAGGRRTVAQPTYSERLPINALSIIHHAIDDHYAGRHYR